MSNYTLKVIGMLLGIGLLVVILGLTGLSCMYGLVIWGIAVLLLAFVQSYHEGSKRE